MKLLSISLLSTSILSGCASVHGLKSESHINTKIADIKEFSNSNDKRKTSILNFNPNNGSNGYQYKVGIGDVLNITIWDHPELTTPAGSYRSSAESGNWVHEDGKIFYPYIGKIHVEGKTVSEIRDLIAKKLATYIENPQVDINVASFKSQNVYMTGEVNKQDKIAITNVPLTVLDAINKSGGITDDADWKNVTLTRNGQEIKIPLNELLLNGDLSKNHLLIDGDIIHVPRNDTQKVFVLGEVNTPSVVSIGRNELSLTEAISSVGGIDKITSDSTGIFVFRKGDNNEIDIYQLDLTQNYNLILGTDFVLEPYDVVYVTASHITKWSRLISQLLPTVSAFNDMSEGVHRIKNW